MASLSLAAIARAENVEPNAEAAMAWRLDALSSGLLGPDRPTAAFKLSAGIARRREIAPHRTAFPPSDRWPRPGDLDARD